MYININLLIYTCNFTVKTLHVKILLQRTLEHRSLLNYYK